MVTAGLAIPSKDMIMGSRSQVRASSRALTPITGPRSGSHHPKGEAVSGRVNLSATEGNYFVSKKEMSQGASYVLQASSSSEDLSAVAGNIDLAEMVHREEMGERSNAAAASSTGEAISLSLSREGKIKRIRLREEVLAVFPIGSSAAATRSVRIDSLYFSMQCFVASVSLHLIGEDVLQHWRLYDTIVWQY
jgi:hypothetical protein